MNVDRHGSIDQESVRIRVLIYTIEPDSCLEVPRILHPHRPMLY